MVCEYDYTADKVNTLTALRLLTLMAVKSTYTNHAAISGIHSKCLICLKLPMYGTIFLPILSYY